MLWSRSLSPPGSVITGGLGVPDSRLLTDGCVGKLGRKGKSENPSSCPRILRSFNVGISDRSDGVRWIEDACVEYEEYWREEGGRDTLADEGVGRCEWEFDEFP